LNRIFDPYFRDESDRQRLTASVWDWPYARLSLNYTAVKFGYTAKGHGANFEFLSVSLNNKNVRELATKSS
jgi:hypothetical protein